MTVDKDNLNKIKENLENKAEDEDALIRAADEGMAGGEEQRLQEITERIERVDELENGKNPKDRKLKKALEKADFKSAKQQIAAALGEIPSK